MSHRNNNTINNPRDKVVHNYVDRSQEPDPSPEGGDDGKVGFGDQTFPMKLHYILEQGCQSQIISWQPHGRCFVVHDMKEFVSSMLPLWFRQSKFASFQRQLNLYGFQRITQGRDKNSYYHEYFLRGRPLLAQKITRTKVKGKGARKASSPETEPRFYELPWLEDNTARSSQPQVATGTVPEAPPVSAAAIPPPAASAPTIDPTLVALAAGTPAMAVPAVPASAPAAPSLMAPAMGLPAPAITTSLGEALGYLTYSQALSAAQMVAAGSAQLHSAHGETLLLPGFTPQDSSANTSMLNSLLSSIGGGNASSTGARQYVPIAPAPPRQDAGHYKLADANSSTANAGSTETVYGTVLAALKAQHRVDSGAAAAFNAHSGSVFTRPGPPPY
ncbi:shock factor protein [Seminavis robusta]|uniref:Shock factor protein n=1 Tax=Seminavis robusta TaxID=568900 RepID=A0A9N8E3K8_9STRA|nr:shock factor protein [Seminavis robusta]|eukprot:Sro509_g157090.1 shock factor protein (388) ;mRNA; f:43316-44674